MPESANPQAACFLFSGMSDNEVAALLADAPAPERFDKGAIIYSEQRFRRAIGWVLDGRVRVRRGHTVLNHIAAGEVFGAAALYGNEPDYVTEITATTACTVRFLPQDWLRRHMAQNPQLTENYLSFLSGRIRFLNRRIAALTAGDAEQRLLLHLRQRADRAGQLTVPSMAELARELDMGRTSLYRSLELLEQSGQIRRENKRFYIL